MDRDTTNRLLDMYTNLLNYTYNSYLHTNNTIQHIELGIRDLIRQNSHRQNQPIPYMSYNSHTSRNVNSAGGYATGAGAGGYATGAGAGGYATGVGAGAGAGAGANNNRTTWTNRNGVNTRTHTHTQRSRMGDYLSPILTTVFNVDNLSPVVVRPTQTQIETATEIIPFDENMAHNTCPITQSLFQSTDRIARIKQCGHCFIEASLNDWFNQSVRCPVCRYDIREYPRQDISSRTSSDGDIRRNTIRPTRTGTTTVGTTSAGTTTAGTTTDLSNNHTQTVNNVLDIFTNQISESFRQYFMDNDGSFNSLDNGIINIEYVIHPIANLSSPTSSITRLMNPDIDDQTRNRLNGVIHNEADEADEADDVDSDDYGVD